MAFPKTLEENQPIIKAIQLNRKWLGKDWDAVAAACMETVCGEQVQKEGDTAKFKFMRSRLYR